MRNLYGFDLTIVSGCLRDVAMLTSHIPETFKSKVTCQLSESCFGLHCCIDFAFVIPAFENVIQKNVPFYFKFDPCTYVFEVGFGGFHHKENLISYNYGKILQQQKCQCQLIFNVHIQRKLL